MPAFRTLLERFGTLDDLYVVFSAPDGHTVDEYEGEIDAWVDGASAAPELTSCRQRAASTTSRDWGWLADARALAAR